MIWKIIKCVHCLGAGDTRDEDKQVKGTAKNGVGVCTVCGGRGKLLTIKTSLNVILNGRRWEEKVLN